MTDTEAMQRALGLAKRGTGFVSPNPRVGAVILDENGNIISEGWHKKYGGPHAEIEAINNANRDNFSNCTIVLNLEPCFHYGKTPPCVDAIIQKKFKRVVIGMTDPNPLVSGQSIQKLRRVGIEVEVGILENESQQINKAFAKWIVQKEPYTILKIAQSIDGNIALKNGISQWITSGESRSKVQILRSEVDAILIGRNTAIADNPKLTVRDLDLPSPKRIILDSHLSLPPNLEIFTDDNKSNTYIVFDENLINSKQVKYFAEIGVQSIPIKLNSDNEIDLKKLIKKLGAEFSITSLMVEGGAKLFSNFVREKLADELHLFIAPKILGNGLHTFSELNFTQMQKAIKLQVNSLEKLGEDIYIIATRAIVSND